MSDNIYVTVADAHPISITIEDAQPIEITLEAGSAGANDIFSNPPSGCYKIVNIYLNASLHVVIVYNNVAEA